MTLQELGTVLQEMYFNSKEGESVVMIHLFGVKYADEIKNSGASKREIVEAAGPLCQPSCPVGNFAIS